MAGSGEKWRWADSEGVQRVVPIDELRTALANGVLPPTTLVWRAGMPKWQRASEVPELLAAPAPSLKSTIVGIPPPPASMVAVQAAYEQKGLPKSSSGAANTAPASAPSAGSGAASSSAAAPATGVKKSASEAASAKDGKKSVANAAAAGPSESKKKSVPPSGAAAVEPKKKSVPPADTAGKAEGKKESSAADAPVGAAKKKSMPPPAPPAPVIKPLAAVGAVTPKGDAAKPQQVPPNAWGAGPATKPSARASVQVPATVDKSAPPPAADTPSADANRNPAPVAPGSAQAPTAQPYAAAPGRDESELETWVLKPAPSPQELAAAVQRASATAPQGAGAPGVTPPPPSATPPPPPAAQGPGAKGSTFPLTALPPMRMTSPLPPPPRRSHPAPPGSVTPSTAPQAFSQSAAAQMPPFAGRDGLAPPSVPPLHRPSFVPTSASPNGAAEGDLPAFPLDEIDPDDERPFRPSQSAGTSPSGHPATLDADEHSSGGSLRGVLAYIRANPKDPKLLAALSGGAVLVVGLLWGVAAMSGSASETEAADDSAKSARSGAEPAASAATASSAAAAQAGASAAAKATACRVAGTPARLAEKASKDVPLELLVASSGERVRVGLATSINAALGISVDLNSLQVTPEFTKPPRDRLRAVIPFGEDGPEFVAQLEGHADKMKAWRTISHDPPTVIGWSGSALAVASKAKELPTPLWPLEGADPIDVIRAAHTSDRAHAIVFRRHGAIYGGMIGPDRAPVGELTKIAGAGAPPGSPVGTPTVAVNGQSVAVAFADRASADEPWSIRIGTAPLGSFPPTTSPFSVPAGGPGGAALAPALSGLPDGRWLLVWTEGSGGAHDVRGMTLGADLSPVGAALTVSREGSNAGQGAVALRAGRGLVAYLALTEEGYELWGTSVDCR